MPRLSAPGMLQARIQAIGSPKRTAELANAEADRMNRLDIAELAAQSRVQAAQAGSPSITLDRPGGLGGGFSGNRDRGLRTSRIGAGGLQDRISNRLDSRLGGLQRREHGGDVNEEQPYLVGEKGPELMVPEGSGAVIPAHELALLSPKTLQALGVTPKQYGGGYGDEDEIIRFGTKQPVSNAEFFSNLGTSIGDAYQSTRDLVSPQSTFTPDEYNPFSGIQQPNQALKTKPQATGANTSLLHPNAIALQQQQARGEQIPADWSPVQRKKTAQSDEDPFISFQKESNFREFLNSPESQQFFNVQDSQPPQSDPRLTAMFDNQNPNAPTTLGGGFNRQYDTSLNQPGAYSPADVHARQEYIKYRDSDQNQTRFSPTNFDASGLDNYNAQGLNTSGTIQGAIPWQGDVRGLNRDQIGQLQLQQNLGGRGARDFNAAQLGQQNLALDERRLSHNIAQSGKPVTPSYTPIYDEIQTDMGTTKRLSSLLDKTTGEMKQVSGGGDQKSFVSSYLSRRNKAVEAGNKKLISDLDAKAKELGFL